MGAKARRVLLVEDEAGLAQELCGRLRALGYEVVRSIDELGAAEADVALIDVDGGGADAARAVLERRRLPAIFLADRCEPDAVAVAERIAYGLVAKSSPASVLDATIRMALEHYEAEREPPRTAEPGGSSPRPAETRATLEACLDSPKDLYFVSIGKDYRCLFRNRAYHDIKQRKFGIDVKIGDPLLGYAERDPYLEGSLGHFERALEGESSRVVEHYACDDSFYETFYNPIVDEASKVIGAAAFATEVGERVRSQWAAEREEAERKRAFEALREREMYFRKLAEDMPAFICSFMPNGALTYVNAALAAFVSRSPADLEGQVFFDLLEPAEARALRGRLADLTPASPTEEHEQTSRGSDGRIRFQEWRNRAFFDEEGKPTHFSGIGFDVTDRKRSEGVIRKLLHEKELLLKEVHHRVKNNMNTISSLLSIQEQRQTDETTKNVLRETAGRVDSMMLLYEKLYESANYKDISAASYLAALVPEIIGIFPSAGLVELRTSFEDFPLDSRSVSALGIIVNELITNSMKYAFPGGRGGTISLRASKQGNRAIVEYADDGVGMAKASADRPRGFGLQLVEMLVEQLHGHLSVESQKGTRYVIEFDA